VLYARVSTQEQKARLTVQQQVTLLEATAAARTSADLPAEDRIEVVASIVDDGQSGTVPLAERLEGRRLLELIRSGAVDEVWITKLDRAARRLRVLLDIHDELERHSIALVAIRDSIDTSTHTGRLIFHVLGSIAEWEASEISSRMSEGRATRAQKGLSIGGHSPFGFTLDGDGRYLPDEEPFPGLGESPADVVRWLYRRVGDERATCYATAQELTARGVPLSRNEVDGRKPNVCKHGFDVAHGVGRRTCMAGRRWVRADGVWSGERVRAMLIDSRYMGVGRVERKKGAPIDFTLPALVDTELWQRTQRQIATNKLRSSRNAKRSYLLSGLVRCGAQRDGQRCGRTLTGFYCAKSKRLYYRVHTGGPYSPKCVCRSVVPGLELERAVWGEVVRVLRDPRGAFEAAQAKLAAARAAGPDPTAHLAALDAQLAALRAERERTLVLFRKGHLLEPETDTLLADIAARTEAVERERAPLASQAALSAALDERLETAEASYARYRAEVERIDAADDAEARRSLVQTLVSEVEISYTKIGSQHQRRARVTLDLGSVFEPVVPRIVCAS
jgi:site-specific DNA recombinase